MSQEIGVLSRGAPTLTALLRMTAQTMVAELVRRIHDAGYPGISGAHHPLFENIDPAGTRLTTLAARAGMTHQSMSELVQTLERRGYVERIPDPSDGRARLVMLTPTGRRMVRRALREIIKLEREWTTAVRDAGLDGDLKQALATVLRTRA